MSVPLPLRSALGPCLGVASARAGNSFLSGTHCGKLRFVTAFQGLKNRPVTDRCKSFSLSNSPIRISGTLAEKATASSAPMAPRLQAIRVERLSDRRACPRDTLLRADHRSAQGNTPE